MFLRKTAIKLGESYHGDNLSTMLEPLPGHTEQEVVSLLREHGAREITILAPGFVSAIADGSALNAASAIAHIQLKPRKQTR